MTESKEQMQVFPIFGEILHPEIAELENPITNIVSQVIEDGNVYDAVVAEGLGGGIPAIVVHKVLKDLYLVNEPKPLMLELTDTGPIPHELSRIKSISESFTDSYNKILLVTEYIWTGKTVSFFYQALAEKGIACDVATITIEETPEKLNPSIMVYVGSDRYGPSSIVHNSLKHGFRDKDVRRDIGILEMKVLANLQRTSL